jgi:LysR family glycine cleavage system transcriptional activator
VRHRPELEERKVPPPSWADWFAKCGVEDVAMPDGAVFPHTSMAIQAAVDGVGVALARSAHIVDQLERGQLVTLFKPVLPSDSIYYLLAREGHQPTGPMRAFRQWVKREATFAQAIYDQQAAPSAAPSQSVTAVARQSGT